MAVMSRFLFFALWLSASLALAQQPGPGIPNISYPLSKLGDLISDDNGYKERDFPTGIICRDLGRTSTVSWHRGYVLASSQIGGGGDARGQCVLDLSDPANPSIAFRFLNGRQGGNGHSTTKKESTVSIGNTFSVDPDGTVRIGGAGTGRDVGGSGRGGLFAGWWTDFKWSYGVPQGKFRLREKAYRAVAKFDQVTHAEIDVTRETGIAGSHPFILGNLLIYASDQQQRGVAAYDISDPRNPVLLDVMNDSNGIGGYWVEVWKHYLIFPRRRALPDAPEGYNGTVYVVDFQDPTELKFVGAVPIKGSPMYAQMKDHYVFTDNTKIDLSPIERGEPPVAVLEFNDFDYQADMSQFALPIGNLVAAGGGVGIGGVSVWVHDTEPDTKCPEIAHHYPLPGEQEYSTEAPVSIMIHETIETNNLILGETWFVREVGTEESLVGDNLYTSSQILSFNPRDNFKPGTEYEIVFTEDAFTDAVGNPICDTTGPGDGIAYRSTFRTTDGSNPLPRITSFSMNAEPPFSQGQTVSFSFTAEDNNNLEYRLDFGDGDLKNRNRTEWTGSRRSITQSLANTFNKPGNFRATLQVREVGSLTRLATSVLNFVVKVDEVGPRGTQSTQMALDEARRVLWTVNPDNDTVTLVSADSHAVLAETRVGLNPTSVAVDNNGYAWVVNRDDDNLVILSPGGSVTKQVAFDYGSRPISVVMTPDRSKAFVALEGKNRIAELDTRSKSFIRLLPQQPGVNYEMYYEPGGAGADKLNAAIPTASDIKPVDVTHRFNGTWEEVVPYLGAYFEDNFPAAKRIGLRGAGRVFAYIYRGKIVIPRDGNYTFYVGARNHQDVILKLAGFPEQRVYQEETRNHEYESRVYTLSAGEYPFSIRYLGKQSPFSSRPSDLKFEWEGPGIDRQSVPKQVLRPLQERRRPRALAVSKDGRELFVTQFISDDNAAKIARYNLSTDQWMPTIKEFRDEKSGDSGAFARGVPNYLLTLESSPDGSRLWFGAKKDNVVAGNYRGSGNGVNNFETTIRAIIGSYDLSRESGWVGVFSPGNQQDIDNHALPSQLKFGTNGTKLFLTFLANNELVVIDPETELELDRVKVGIAPTAIAIDPVTSKVFVKNFLSRSISVFDGSDTLNLGIRNLSESFLTEIRTVSRESLSPKVLLGKQLFYSARDLDDHDANPARMSQDGYISCATCHLDGGDDGRTWDRLHLGEGLRNTTVLWGKNGMAQGNVHWSGNFDEIQDFELDMRGPFGGRGMIPEEEEANTSLGAPNAGRSELLDALAAYVRSLGKSDVPKSPYKAANGKMTPEALRGKALFEARNCTSCHNPERDYSDSSLGANATLHDVGTLKASSGSRLGEALSGIDTPGLRGLHASAPYLHDGTAATVQAVFDQGEGSGKGHDLTGLSFRERNDLIQFLLQLDSSEEYPLNPPRFLRPRS